MMKWIHAIYLWLSEKGFFHLLSANYLVQFLSLGASLFVAKYLNPTELGEIRIIQYYVAIFAMFATLGLDTAVLKFCSESIPAERKIYILRFSTQYSLVATVLIIAALFPLSYFKILVTSPHMALWFMIFSLSIPFSALTQMLMTYLQALKEIKKMARLQIIVRMISFVLIIAATWQWKFPGFIIASLLSCVVGFIPVLSQVKLDFFRAKKTVIPAGFSSLAFFSVMGNGINRLGQYGDVFILDHFNRNREVIGYYSIALIFITAATQVTATIQSIVTPHISEKSSDEKWIRMQIKRNQLRMTALGLFVSAGTYILAWLCIHFIYGPRYYVTLTFLPILLLRYAIYSSYAVIGASFVGMGLMKYNLCAMLISTPLGLFLSYLFLKDFGVTGVAWAQVAAASINFMLFVPVYPFVLTRLYKKGKSVVL